MTATDPVSWSGEPAEFDDYAAEYKGGLDNPVKRLLGNSPDQFIAVKARWLMRHEPMRLGHSSVEVGPTFGYQRKSNCRDTEQIPFRGGRYCP